MQKFTLSPAPHPFPSFPTMTWTISLVTHNASSLGFGCHHLAQRCPKSKVSNNHGTFHSMIQTMMLKAFPTKTVDSKKETHLEVVTLARILHSLSHFMFGTSNGWMRSPCQAKRPGLIPEIDGFSIQMSYPRHARGLLQDVLGPIQNQQKNVGTLVEGFKNCFGFFSMVFLRQAAAWIR